jgi:hypothetical protein
MISSTVLYSDDSEETRRKIPIWVDNVLSDWATNGNKVTTKSILLSEALRFHNTDDFDDEIARSREHFEDVLGAQISEAVLKIKLSHRSPQDLHDAFNGPSDTLTDNPTKFQLQPQIDRIMPNRGAATVISNAVVYLYVSAFDDRADRLDCFRELAEYKSQGIEPEHDVARAVVDGESDELEVDSPNLSLSDISDLLRDDRDGWWVDDDLTFADIEDYQSSSARLKNTEWEERFEAFSTALRNSDGLTEQQAYDKMGNLFGVKYPQLDRHFNNFCGRYEPDFVDVRDFDDDLGLGNIVKFESANEQEQAVLLDIVFGTSAEDGEDKLDTDNVRNGVELAGWEDFNTRSDFVSWIKMLDREHGISHYNGFEKGGSSIILDSV